jgi:LysM repeat protein
MLVPNRHGSRSAYRYGFNGMEKDDELKGIGNSYEFGNYGYDPRTGRRWNIDPLARYWQSPYVCFNNSPIVFADPDGLEGVPKQKKIEKGDTFYDIAKSSEGSITVSDLTKWNPGVDHKNLKIGSSINISDPNKNLSIGKSDSRAMKGEQGNNDFINPKSSDISGSSEMDDDIETLQKKMIGALSLGTFGTLDDEAEKLANHFFTGNGTDRYSKVIANSMVNEQQFKKMKNFIIASFKGQMILNKGDYSQIVLTVNNLPYFGKSDPQLLTLVGGTQQLDIFLSSISIDGNSYSAELTYELSDTFGVDEADVIKPLPSFVAGKGLRSMWILQHRHGFRPFKSIFKFKTKVNGKF